MASNLISDAPKKRRKYSGFQGKKNANPEGDGWDSERANPSAWPYGTSGPYKDAVTIARIKLDMVNRDKKKQLNNQPKNKSPR